MDFPLIQQLLAGLQPPGTGMCSSSSSEVPSTCLKVSSPGWRKEKEMEELNLLINHDRKLCTLFPLSLLARDNHMTSPSCKDTWKMWFWCKESPFCEAQKSLVVSSALHSALSCLSNGLEMSRLRQPCQGSSRVRPG